jgi:hypothetical protein
LPQPCTTRFGSAQSGQDEIHDGSGVAVRLGGQFGPLAGRAEDHPDHDRAVEAVEQEVNGGVGGKLAAVDGPVQQRPGPLDVRDNDLAGEPGLQGRDDGGLQVDPQNAQPSGLALLSSSRAAYSTRSSRRFPESVIEMLR